MATAKVRLMPRKEPLTPIAGTVLRQSATSKTEYADAVLKLTTEMTEWVTQEVRKLFSSDAADVLDAADTSVAYRQALELGFISPPTVATMAYAMDATLTDQASRLMRKMEDRFTVMFDRAASLTTKKMIDKTLDNSAFSLKGSLKDFSSRLTINLDTMTPQLKNTIQASTDQAVALIKRVPQDYLSRVQGDVMRSITSGNGLEDLIPALEEQNVQIKNWARNTALDQTRKAYGSINKARMESIGMKKFEWIHTGGSNKPRELHMLRFPAGLNGGIYSFDDLPIIDERTGERGIPGQAINCHCTMRPIISFDTDGKDKQNADDSATQ